VTRGSAANTVMMERLILTAFDSSNQTNKRTCAIGRVMPPIREMIQCQVTQVNKALHLWPRDESVVSQSDSCDVWARVFLSLLRMSPVTAALRVKNSPQYADAKKTCFVALPLLGKFESFLKKKRRGNSTPTNIPTTVNEV